MTSTDRVFELRSYVATPGKREALERRFRDHTLSLFSRHGIEVVGFFRPADAEEDALVYLCAFPSRDAAKQSWAAFQADPDWIAAKTASEVDGPLTVKVESRFLEPTDYSLMR